MKHISNAFAKVAVVAVMLAFFYFMYQQGQVPESVKRLEEQQQIARLVAKEQDRRQAMREWAEFRRTVYQVSIVVIWGMGLGLTLGATGAGLLVLTKVRNARQRVYARDGLFPAIVLDQGSPWDRLTGRSRQLVMNPNAWALPAATVATDGNGEPRLLTALDGFTHDQLLTAHAGQQRVQQIQAAKGRTPAQHKPNKWEVLERNGLLPEPKRYALPVPEETPDEEPELPQWTVIDALKHSDRDNFYLGQDDRGKPLALSLRSAVHMAILGNTGCGKTASTGYQLALSAISGGYRLIILDGKWGMDWTPFEAVAEWHGTDQNTFLPQMETIHREYEERLAISQRYQVKHISEVDAKDYPPILVIVEEYGDLARLTPKANMARIEGMLDSLAAKGRAAGIHFALIDQYPESWSQVVLGATKAKILYQMGDGGKVHDYHVVNLPDYGRFRYKKHEYNSWHVEPQLPKLITDVQKAQSRNQLMRYPALIEGDYSVVSGGNSTGNRQETEETGNSRGNTQGNSSQERNGSVSSVSSGNRGGDQGQNTHPYPPTGNTGNSGNTDDEHGLTETQIKVWRHMKQYPDLGVRERAELLDVSPGYVSKLYRRRAEYSKGKVH